MITFIRNSNTSVYFRININFKFSFPLSVTGMFFRTYTLIKTLFKLSQPQLLHDEVIPDVSTPDAEATAS